MKNLHTLDSGHSDPSAFSHMPANAQAADEERTVRPSTARRHENLRSLVAELSSREMGYVGVATHLNCSASSARNYISHLLDLGVIVSSPNKAPAGAADRTVFRAGRRSLELSQGTLNRNGDSHLWLETAVSLVRPAGLAPVRDPLVAALFGSPPERVDEFETPGLDF
jgi:hypothetical protein